jgi:cytochrome d ubiquinol oxidase subunit I
MALVALTGAGLAWRGRRLPDQPWYLRALVACGPLGFVAIEAGWTVTEVGRQPWIVYGMMKTSDAASRLAASQVGLSLAAFILLYSALGIVCFWLIAKYARTVPEPALVSVHGNPSPERVIAG